jgi:hypothetical protein
VASARVRSQRAARPTRLVSPSTKASVSSRSPDAPAEAEGNSTPRRQSSVRGGAAGDVICEDRFGSGGSEPAPVASDHALQTVVPGV